MTISDSTYLRRKGWVYAYVVRNGDPTKDYWVDPFEITGYGAWAGYPCVTTAAAMQARKRRAIYICDATV